eukprot:3389261-Prymnesium_polylepis.1
MPPRTWKHVTTHDVVRSRTRFVRSEPKPRSVCGAPLYLLHISRVRPQYWKWHVATLARA